MTGTRQQRRAELRAQGYRRAEGKRGRRAAARPRARAHAEQPAKTDGRIITLGAGKGLKRSKGGVLVPDSDRA